MPKKMKHTATGTFNIIMRTLNKNIVALGANSFFTDFSTEMILPLLPLFLDRFLHATKGEIGLIEGIG